MRATAPGTQRPFGLPISLGIGWEQKCCCLLLLVLILGFTVDLPLAEAQTFETLYSFSGGADGRGPFAGVIRDSVGNLYGTTWEGGDLSACDGLGCGVVFKIDSTGKETVLYAFSGGSDGGIPEAPLIRDSQGNLYGTAVVGGDLAYCGGFGSCGVVFKLDASNTYSVIHAFNGSDGASPMAALVRDSADNLYGTTFGGGPYGYGTAFKIDSSGNETVLHSFSEGSDGGLPKAQLISDSAGSVLGTSRIGPSLSDGGVFKIDSTGTFTVLHNFSGSASDGGEPEGGLLVIGTSLYGTTRFGGSPPSQGIVFSLNKNNVETILHRFTGTPDGANPSTTLIKDAAGNLYGTTVNGGAFGFGTVFKLTTGGKETILYSFTGGVDGAHPYGALVRDSAGNLYGTTSDFLGGSGFGTVFKIIP